MFYAFRFGMRVLTHRQLRRSGKATMIHLWAWTLWKKSTKGFRMVGAWERLPDSMLCADSKEETSQFLILTASAFVHHKRSGFFSYHFNKCPLLFSIKYARSITVMNELVGTWDIFCDGGSPHKYFGAFPPHRTYQQNLSTPSWPLR